LDHLDLEPVSDVLFRSNEKLELKATTLKSLTVAWQLSLWTFLATSKCIIMWLGITYHIVKVAFITVHEP